MYSNSNCNLIPVIKLTTISSNRDSRITNLITIFGAELIGHLREMAVNGEKWHRIQSHAENILFTTVATSIY